MAEETRPTAPDHLFISYASEDWRLAEWLTLKLTAAGYRVWCDRFQLLGGESYPRDIDVAVKQQTFRVIALLSRSSMDKPNPMKERTLALNISRDRRVDFLIPLNVDGLRSTELDWMTSDLTFIPFERWNIGLINLFRKLQQIDCPRGLGDGQSTVRELIASREEVLGSPERVWSNACEIVHIPDRFFRYIGMFDPMAGPTIEGVAFVQSPDTFWSFVSPSRAVKGLETEEFDCKSVIGSGDEQVRGPLTALIRANVRQFLLDRGLESTPDGDDVYFPRGLFPGDRLNFEHYDGGRSWVQVAGFRSFRSQSGTSTLTRYHVCPRLDPRFFDYSAPAMELSIRLYLTDQAGNPLHPSRVNRRRRKIVKDWWNHEWLSRHSAVLHWLSDGRDLVVLTGGSEGEITFRSRPWGFMAPVSIREPVEAINRAEDDVVTEQLVEDDEPEDPTQIESS
ncbi:MAG: toll/interleukin-1 receptor domain-containing protein [Chloroflexi bacterium]|nr:toll/interleukin-1 receptor domain-containing protein [Chloroflexota bacterium]